MFLRSLSRLKLPLAFLLALAIAGCAGMDEWGAERKTPLPGQRKALFPEGIPGVEFGAPPAQPSNSNIAINQNTMPPAQGAQQPDMGDQQAERPAAQPKQKQPARTAARKKSTGDEDPWVEAR